jgi:zinc transport system substrate-binding protein
MLIQNDRPVFSAFVAICAFIVLASGCSSRSDQESYEQNSSLAEKSVGAMRPFKIVTSFYPIYIMTLNLTDGIENVIITNLTQPNAGCLHDYSPSVSEFRALADADVLVVNGAGMESFLDRIPSLYRNIRIIRLADGLDLIRNGDAINPHIWVSVRGAISEVKILAAELSKIDPVHTKDYQKNVMLYTAKLDALDRKMHMELMEYEGTNIITFHEAFPYFAKEFGLNISAVIEYEPGSAPSARELADMVEVIRKKKIKALFAEPQYPSVSAQTISRETGLTLYYLDPAVTGAIDKDAYIKAMEKNLQTLKKALK